MNAVASDPSNRLGIIIAIVVLPPLIYHGNPAVALLVGWQHVI